MILLNMKSLTRCVFLTGLAAAFCAPAHAVDGVILIDQNKALAGNVTPGDAPGFPVTITQPGSYRLSGNLTVPDQNTTAIVIQTGDVSIDFNGFGIRGPGLPGGGRGVDTTGQNFISLNASVTNGWISGVGGDAVVISGGVVENMRIHNNGGNGILVAFAASRITNNVVANNFVGINDGFDGTPGSSFRGNIVSGPGNGGRLFANCPSVIVGNSAAVITTSSGCTRDQNSPAP